VQLRYSVVGLGKLGASMAAAIASRGFDVVGMDVNPRAIELVNAGRAPVLEPGLDALIFRHRSHLRATESAREAVLESDVTFVVVPTPSDECGAFSVEYAAQAFAEIGRALADKEGYHVVVLTSTVLPGATRHVLAPILERTSGKKCGDDVGVCYSPEFVAFGSVVSDFLNPDFILIGEHDDRAGGLLDTCYAEITENGAPCGRMSLENAELAKIALNAFVTTKIAFANTLADLCEQIPGGDVDAVADALGLDRRIGRDYLTGGLGYGGPYFPRDNAAFGFFAAQLGVPADLSAATDQLNRARVGKIVARVLSAVPRCTKAAVLGLAYKPGSNVLEGSQGVEIARRLADAGVQVVAFDPLVYESSPAQLDGKVEIADSIWECLAGAEVVIVATPDPEFATLSHADFEHDGRTVTVVDCWRTLDPRLADDPAIDHVRVGLGRDTDVEARRLVSLWNGERVPEPEYAASS